MCRVPRIRKHGEPLALRVSNWLIRRDYVIAAPTGVTEIFHPEHSDAIGILVKQKIDTKWERILNTIMGSRRIFIGVLYFRNEERGATVTHWVFDFYGQDHAGLALRLAQKLHEAFGVQVTTRLASEEVRFERFMLDFA